jgi:sugar phosphate isomerase/epimerase
MRLCFSATAESTVQLESVIHAVSDAGFRCLELPVDALEDYLSVYPSVLLDTLLREHHCHIGAVSGLKLGDRVESNDPVQISVSQARFLENCAHLDGLGGGFITISVLRDHQNGLPSEPLRDPPCDQRAAAQTPQEVESTAPAVHWMRVLSSLAAPFDVQVGIECCASVRDDTLSLTAATDILSAAGRQNTGLVLDVDASESLPAQLPKLETGTTNLLLVRVEVSPRQSNRLTIEGYRGLYSIKPPAGLAPLEAARIASDYAASIGFPLPAPRTL